MRVSSYQKPVKGAAVKKRLKSDAVSANLAQLRGASIRVARKREKLPHQLFWSLFHSEIDKIKKKKYKKQLVQELLFREVR